MNLNLKAISSLFSKKAIQTVAQETKTASSVLNSATAVKQALPEIVYATEAQIKAAAAKHTLRQSNSVAFDFGNQMKNNEAKALYNKLQAHSETLKKLEEGGAPEHLMKLQMKKSPIKYTPENKVGEQFNSEKMKNLKENQQLKKFLGGYEQRLESHKKAIAEMQYNAQAQEVGGFSLKNATLGGMENLKDPDICLKLLDTPVAYKKGTATIKPFTKHVKEANNHLTQIIADAGKSPKRAEVLLNKLNKELSASYVDNTEFASLINAVGRTGDESQLKALYNSLESFMSTNKHVHNLDEIVTGIKNLSQNNNTGAEFLKIPKRVLSDPYFNEALTLRTNATQAISNFEGQYDYLKNLLVTNRLNSFNRGEPLASVFKSAVKDGPNALKDFKELVLNTNSNLFNKIVDSGYAKNLSKEETNILKTKILQHLYEPQYQKALKFDERKSLNDLMH